MEIKRLCLRIFVSNDQNLRLRGLILHHDITSAHTAGATRDFIADKPIQLLSHPPYSPDLAPCDFFVFPKVKDLMRGILFVSPEAAVEVYQEYLETFTRSQWCSLIEKWFERMKLCIQARGEYFEKM